MIVFARTDIPTIAGITCTIERRDAGGKYPATRTVQFADKDAAMAFRAAVYSADLARWKQARREARAKRKAGHPCVRPQKIRRPEMLAICWHSLSLRFVKKSGDFAREQNNRAGRLI